MESNQQEPRAVWEKSQQDIVSSLDSVIQAQIRKALDGDTEAAKFVAEFAKPFVFSSRF